MGRLILIAVCKRLPPVQMPETAFFVISGRSVLAGFFDGGLHFSAAELVQQSAAVMK